MAGVVITVNGVDLATFAGRVERMQRTTPPLRGADILVAGRHGALPVLQRPHSPGAIVWPMWVKGVDPTTGLISAGTTIDQIRGRYDDMSRLFHADPLDVRYIYPDGVVRQATARLALEPLEFDEQPGAVQFGRFAPALSIPDAFWADVDPVTTGALTYTSTQQRTLTAFAGATAPMSDLTVTFGPGNNPEIRQPATGAFIAYDGVIGAGQTLTIYCDDTVTAQLVGTGGLVPDYTKIRFLPPRWFDLNPAAGLTVEVRHTGGGTMNCTVAGRRKYLTG